MLITEQILGGITRDAAGVNNGKVKMDQWFSENEPVFYKWMVDRANGMMNISIDGYSVIIQPSIQKKLVERMISCLQMGYIVATVASNVSHLEEIGVHSFLSTTDGDANEIYSMWLLGKLGDQYYTEEVGSVAPLEDYKEAIKNFRERQKEREIHEGKIKVVKIVSGTGKEPDSEEGSDPSGIQLGGMEL